jgi:hypothetical protein
MMSCSHIDQIRPVKPQTQGCGECLKLRDDWSTSAYFGVWPRWLLRFLEKQTRDQTLSSSQAPHYEII